MACVARLRCRKTVASLVEALTPRPGTTAVMQPANAALTCLIGQAAGAQITITDAHRHAHFHVNGFCLMGIETADGPPGEMDLIVEMVGTSIDPSVLREAATVADALSAIAVNAGNAACAQLEACRKRALLSASSLNVPAAAASSSSAAATTTV